MAELLKGRCCHKQEEQQTSEADRHASAAETLCDQSSQAREHGREEDGMRQTRQPLGSGPRCGHDASTWAASDGMLHKSWALGAINEETQGSHVPMRASGMSNQALSGASDIPTIVARKEAARRKFNKNGRPFCPWSAPGAQCKLPKTRVFLRTTKTNG